MTSVDIAAAFAEGAGDSSVRLLIVISIVSLLLLTMLVASLVTVNHEIKRNTRDHFQLYKSLFFILIGVMMIIAIFSLFTI